MSAPAGLDWRARASAWKAAALANRAFAPALGGALGAAAIDQASKAYILHVVNLPLRRHIEITGFFDLTYVRNYGASFGMLAGGLGSRILLSLMAVGIITFLVIWLANLRRRWANVGVAFVIGGALGNLIDRIRFGYVVDFLDFSGLYFPWVFNVADVCINVGIACLIVDAVRQGRAGPGAAQR